MNETDSCFSLIDEYSETLIQSNLLTPYRNIQLSIQLSVIYLLNKDFLKAKKQLMKVMLHSSYANFALFRTAQLINIVACYELEEIDSVESQVLSIKRYNRINKESSEVENVLFRFLHLDIQPMGRDEKQKQQLEIKEIFSAIRNNRKEDATLSFFNFEEWILSHLS